MAGPTVRFQPPAPALRPFITTYYWVDVPVEAGPQDDWLHPEWANIRFALDEGWRVGRGDAALQPPPCALFGPTSRTVAVRSPAPGRVVALGLLPLGFATLFDIDAAALADRVGALDEHCAGAPALYAALAAEPGQAGHAALLDAFFLAHVASRPAAPDLLRRAHAALLDPDTLTVEAFAAALGLSPRHLRRLCLRLFGFAPKLLLRRQRFLRTLEAAFAALDRPFAEVLDAAYFDQSHFVRDFHDFMGFSPSAYFHLHRPLLSVAQRERLKALGASFQGLHAERLRLLGESGPSKPEAPVSP